MQPGCQWYVSYDHRFSEISNWGFFGSLEEMLLELAAKPQALPLGARVEMDRYNQKGFLCPDVCELVNLCRARPGLRARPNGAKAHRHEAF